MGPQKQQTGAVKDDRSQPERRRNDDGVRKKNAAAPSRPPPPPLPMGVRIRLARFGRKVGKRGGGHAAPIAAFPRPPTDVPLLALFRICPFSEFSSPTPAPRATANTSRWWATTTRCQVRERGKRGGRRFFSGIDQQTKKTRPPPPLFSQPTTATSASASTWTACATGWRWAPNPPSPSRRCWRARASCPRRRARRRPRRWREA